MQAFRNILSAVAVVALLVVAPLGWAEDAPRAKKPPVDVEAVLADAAKAEADGKYDDALRHYLRAFSAGRTDPDTRDRIRLCFRHVTQAERHRDPAFQKFVAAMPATDAITLYGEVVGEIHKKYADRTKAAVERLFAAGLDELRAALDVPAFREQHLKDADEAKIAEFRTLLRDTKLPTTPREAAQAARAVITAANKTLGLKSGAAVVFELLCGACTGLDEYSSYVPPGGADPSPLAELAGYGLVVKVDGQGLLVEAVQPRSWAATMTKLRKGDRIRKVNGRSVAGATPAVIAEALRAVEGHGHLIELVPADDTADSVRLPTPVPTVYAAELIDMKEGVGYLRLAAFKDRTPQEFDDAVMELKARGMKALVIDIRGNSGGLFAAAVGIAKRLLPGGAVATTDGQVPDFASRVFSSDSGMDAHDFPGRQSEGQPAGHARRAAHVRKGVDPGRPAVALARRHRRRPRGQVRPADPVRGDGRRPAQRADPRPRGQPARDRSGRRPAVDAGRREGVGTARRRAGHAPHAAARPAVDGP